MKIILCYPPKREYPGYGQEKRWLPLGIASLGAYIKREYPDDRTDVTLLDLFDYTIEDAWIEINKYTTDYDTNIVGFTCFTEQRHSTFELCKMIKTLNPTIITVIGGPHAFLMADQIFDNYSDYIDIIIKGEGEKAFRQVIYNELNNFTYKRIIEADIIHDLDSLPHAIDGFDLFANVPPEIEAEAPIVMSRGCTDYCSFCSTTKFWKGYRSRSAQNVFEEMCKYNEKYGTTKFKFHDDASTADLQNWKDLCNLILFNQKKDWEFEITARADQFDDKLIGMLALAGCKRVAVGIESGNKGLRKAMNKHLDIELAKSNMKKLMQAGIEVVCLFIVGYPGESEDTIQETIDFIKEVRPSSWCCQPLMIFPGTKVYRQCVERGWINDDYWLQDLPQPYYILENSYEQLREWTKKLLQCMKRESVLICAPVHQDEQIFNLYLESLRNLEYDHSRYDVAKLFILHNCEQLQQYIRQDLNEGCLTYNNSNTYECEERTHLWRERNFHDVVFMKNKLLEIAKLNNFDYIFFVDSDLVLHPYTLKQLLSSDKDMVSEIFWTKWNAEDKNQPVLPNCWDHDSYNITEESYIKWKKPGLYQVGMTGACTLIKRHVIESPVVNWNPVKNVSYTAWEDRAFCVRVACAGFEIWTDTNWPAKHLYRKSELEAYLKERENCGK